MENAKTQFWHQPTNQILGIWYGIKRKRQEEVNSYSLTTATLTANLVAFMRSFGDSKDELPTRDDYLPFRFVDPNSPKAQLQRKLSPQTIQITKDLIDQGKIPPKFVKALYQVEGMMEVINT